MPVNVKALIVVLALSGLVFAFGKRTALHFMEEADFRRRRNVWLILSAAAFLSPTFWWFAPVAIPVLYWAGKKDTNPLAFYLLVMNVIPSIHVDIPTVGINHLFDLDIFRLLSLCVVVPAALRVRKSRKLAGNAKLDFMDVLLLGYGVLQVALFVPPDLPSRVVLHSSPTNDLRTAFLFLVDIYFLYYLASRSCTSRRAFEDSLAAFCLACTILATIALFESLKHWLLYADISARWGGDVLDQQYLIRGGILRAEASSGNALALGYLLAIAFGFWLYLRSRLPNSSAKYLVPALYWLGLIASFSRGPWLGAIAIYLAYAAFAPSGGSRVLKASLAAVMVFGLVLLSPLGTKIERSLPFMGGRVGAESLTYRERLLERSWELIQAHPTLGDQDAYSQMQDLRQGQGIIDIVNTYVGVALFYGFIGLSLFLAFILAGLSRARRSARGDAQRDPDGPLLGACIASCIVGTLLMLADCSFILGYVSMFYALAGLSTAYYRFRGSPHPELVSQAAHATEAS